MLVPSAPPSKKGSRVATAEPHSPDSDADMPLGEEIKFKCVFASVHRCVRASMHVSVGWHVYSMTQQRPLCHNSPLGDAAMSPWQCQFPPSFQNPFFVSHSCRLLSPEYPPNRAGTPGMPLPV